MIFIIYVIVAGDDSGHFALQVLPVFLHHILKTDNHEKNSFSDRFFEGVT